MNLKHGQDRNRSTPGSEDIRFIIVAVDENFLHQKKELVRNFVCNHACPGRQLN